MNEDREQAFDDFLETRAWDAAQQALFDALRAAFLAGWAAAPCARQSGRGTGAGKRASSHHPLPPLCKGRWRTNVSRRGCRSGAGEGGLVPSARSYTIPTTPQSGPAALPAPLTQGSQALRGTKVPPRREPGGRNREPVPAAWGRFQYRSLPLAAVHFAAVLPQGRQAGSAEAHPATGQLLHTKGNTFLHSPA